ncbi:uncharacterized protein LOC106419600 [Brassica napus]|uniref:uncharacterized protein LOC106319902 n=1 Tax=Brassica oleracea var. oleracea TaxID=109376 RepID=UPI0006A6F229|nr:PREDICTED: uncharacterized protein LOC106319902 [Brassica oleracea var. oleracea]XP_013715869.1 uncharacterized protein LOC106419600 [Brassica napus]
MEPTLGKFNMDKFDGKGDFVMWKFKMMGQLKIQGLLAVIVDGFTVYSTSEKQEEGEKHVIDQKKFEKDLRVRSLLDTCLSDSILRKVMHEQTALGMWKSLEKL